MSKNLLFRGDGIDFIYNNKITNRIQINDNNNVDVSGVIIDNTNVENSIFLANNSEFQTFQTNVSTKAILVNTLRNTYKNLVVSLV